MVLPTEAAYFLVGKRHEFEMVLDGNKRSCGFGAPSGPNDCSFTDGSSGTLFAITVPGVPNHVSVRLLTNGVVKFEGSPNYESNGCPPVIDVRLHAVGEL